VSYRLVVSAAGSDYHLVTVDILERLSPTYWWDDPGTTIEGPIPIGFAIALGVVMVVAIAVWILAPRLAPEQRLLQRLIARVAKWTLAFAVIGLLLLLCRWQVVPFFSKRLWFAIWGASIVGAAIYLGYYWRRVYPLRVAAWEEAERRRRYMPRPSQSSGRSRRRSRRRR
jgi:hypothetical protein